MKQKRSNDTDNTELFRNFDEICSRRGRPQVPSQQGSFPVQAANDFDEVASAISLASPAPSISTEALCLSTMKPRPPPLPRSHGRRGPSSTEALSCVGTPNNGDTALAVDGPSHPRVPSWTTELTQMRDWEAKWVVMKSEEDRLLASDCSEEEILRPKSMAQSQLVDLKQELARVTSETERWSDSLWGGLARMRKRVASLRVNACHAGVHTEQLHSVAQCMERELAAFKAQQRQQYDALATSESGLEEILDVLAPRYEAWVAEPSALFRPASPNPDNNGGSRLQHQRGGSCGSRSRGLSTDASSTSIPAHQEDPEICEIRKALETVESEVESAGGSTGGWSEIHHEVFMRIFRMFKMQATSQFFARLEERLPHLPKAHIADHVRWHVEHEQQQATKQRLLARWRERRHELKHKALEAEAELAAEEAEQTQQAVERDLRQRAETKRRLNEWRQRRVQEEQFLAEKQRRSEEDQARSERDQRRQQLQQREVVEVYRRQREAERLRVREEEQQASLVAAAARRAQSQDDRQRITRRNQEALRRKLQAPSPRDRPQSSASCRRGSEPPGASRSQPRAYDHVESRLYDPTTSSTQKTRLDREAREEVDVLLGATTEPRWRNRLRATSVSDDHMREDAVQTTLRPPTAEPPPEVSLIARARALDPQTIEAAVGQRAAQRVSTRMRSM